jgi:hypothetical protein
MKQNISWGVSVSGGELSSILKRVVDAGNDVVSVVRVSDYRYLAGDYYATYLIIYAGAYMGEYISAKAEDEDTK